MPGKSLRVLPAGRPGRLLDFGCGNGAFLERMHAQGWQVTGIDAADPVVARVRPRVPWPVLAGSLPHAELRPASFDVVTMCQALEHVHDPLRVLHEAGRLLVAGGTLLVAVPNIESLPFRWFGNAWIGLDLPRHLTHFAPATLHRMLHRAGFRVQSIRMVRHSHWLRTSAEQSCRRARAPHWHRWLQTRPLSRLATWYAFLTDRADCLLATATRAS
jgi:2-polyprenyl-3-methyl-5-hydroxy-6-metoxy-1,4-benzoquinol methylase